jgi:hypothetical protein
MEALKFEIKKVDVSRTYYHERKNEPFKDYTKMYIFHTGESILDNLQNRRSRPHTIYKKELMPKILEQIKLNYPEVFKEIGNKKWGWRQKCGCSCPCSPGFIAETGAMYDIFVNIAVS